MLEKVLISHTDRCVAIMLPDVRGLIGISEPSSTHTGTREAHRNNKSITHPSQPAHTGGNKTMKTS